MNPLHLVIVYSWPSVPTGSASMQSTNQSVDAEPTDTEGWQYYAIFILMALSIFRFWYPQGILDQRNYWVWRGGSQQQCHPHIGILLLKMRYIANSELLQLTKDIFDWFAFRNLNLRWFKVLPTQFHSLGFSDAFIDGGERCHCSQEAWKCLQLSLFSDAVAAHLRLPRGVCHACEPHLSCV